MAQQLRQNADKVCDKDLLKALFLEFGIQDFEKARQPRDLIPFNILGDSQVETTLRN
jgi:hypothetical protein